MDQRLVDRRAEIERVRTRGVGIGTARGVGGVTGDNIVAPAVRASWARCHVLVDDRRDQAPVEAIDEIPDRWDASPIRRASPELVEHLADAGRDGGMLAIITDGAGQVLWESAPSELRRRAEGVGLVPGGRWHEGAAGTNGIGLALVTGRPTAVFATEHWVEPVRNWVCYSAPVRAPDGSIAGVIDLSTTWDRANPLGLSTVDAFARLMELELAGSWRPGGTAGLDVHVLGRSRVTLDGAPVALSRRQLEIIVTLALVGAATLGELHALLFGDRPVSPTTLRAEISHLRTLLGGAIASRPYRLTLPCRLDVIDVLERLHLADLAGATERYRGSLLPVSEAPLIVERRYHVDVALRTALLLGGTTAELLRFASVHPADIEVVQRAVNVAVPGDPDLPAAVAALAVARADLTV